LNLNDATYGQVLVGPLEGVCWNTGANGWYFYWEGVMPPNLSGNQFLEILALGQNPSADTNNPALYVSGLSVRQLPDYESTGNNPATYTSTQTFAGQLNVAGQMVHTGQAFTLNGGTQTMDLSAGPALEVSGSTASSTINLAASPTNGTVVYVSNTATVNWTLSGNGSNIGAASTATISSAGLYVYRYNGTKWLTVSGGGGGDVSQSSANAFTNTNSFASTTTFNGTAVFNGATTNVTKYLTAITGAVPGGNTITNTASETAFASTYTFGANTVAAGDVYEVEAIIDHSTGAASVGSLFFLLHWAGLAGPELARGDSVTLVTAQSHNACHIRGYLSIVTTGATGTARFSGWQEIETTAGGTVRSSYFRANATDGTTTVTIDTTASAALTLSNKNSAAVSGNTQILTQFVVRKVN
jgi:hypothetical protein